MTDSKTAVLEVSGEVEVRLRDYLTGVRTDLMETTRLEVGYAMACYNSELLRYLFDTARREKREITLDDLEAAKKAVEKPEILTTYGRKGLC